MVIKMDKSCQKTTQIKESQVWAKTIDVYSYKHWWLKLDYLTYSSLELSVL